MYSARAALSNTAAKFCAAEFEFVAYHPKEWHVWGSVDFNVVAVNL
jgi:hypothetical protein